MRHLNTENLKSPIMLSSFEAQQLLNAVAIATASSLGNDYIDTLLNCLADHMSINCAYVARRYPNKENFVKSVTYWGKDGESEISYDLAGSPCEIVYQGKKLIVPCDLPIAFPVEEGEGLFGYLGAPLFNRAGNVDGHLAVFTDKPFDNHQEFETVITIFAARAQAELQRLDLEDELKSKKEIAEKAVKTKALFLAVMGHEIRNPANSLQGIIELLLETKLTNQQQNYVQIMKESGQMMLSLLNDLLDLSKFESDNLELEHTAFLVSGVIQNAISMFEGAARQKSTRIKLEISATSPDVVFGDPLRLKQIFANLISNALKFTNKGLIEIYIDIETRSDGLLAFKAQVSDTGTGFGNIDPQAIFELYQQASSSTARNYGGTGLGLTICKRLCQTMGGDITATASAGGGACFNFSLLFSKTKSTEKLPEVGQTKSRSPLKILVVEDNILNRMLIVAMLKKLGHHIFEAENGLEAVKFVETQDCDVIFMDTEMPEMDGVAATNAIQKMKGPKADIPVIAISGYSSVNLKERYGDLKLHASITKPIKIEDLNLVFNSL